MDPAKQCKIGDDGLVSQYCKLFPRVFLSLGIYNEILKIIWVSFLDQRCSYPKFVLSYKLHA